jgi:hypothetical protein
MAAPMTPWVGFVDEEALIAAQEVTFDRASMFGP